MFVANKKEIFTHMYLKGHFIRLRSRSTKGKRAFHTAKNQQKLHSSRIINQKHIENKKSNHKAVPPDSSNKYVPLTRTFFLGIATNISLLCGIFISNQFAQHMTLLFAIGLAGFSPQVNKFLSQWFSSPKN